MSHYCFFHLILIKRFRIAKLLHITTHRCELCVFLKMLIFICENEGLWQSTLKLITHCLQQLLNSDECLKQPDYISRPYPSLDKE